MLEESALQRLPLRGFPVGAIVFPSGVGIGRENVPLITSVTHVQSALPNLIGWSAILVSGAYTNMALRSSMCCARP